MEVKFLLKHFDELAASEVYEILKLRSEVFVMEQQCLYLDIDDKDQDSYHLMCYIDDCLAGYTRILPMGLSYTEASIGRVVIGVDYRGLKLGRALMEKSIVSCETLFNTSKIRIGAQAHLTGFYKSLGFMEVGSPYDEDGILHQQMFKG